MTPTATWMRNGLAAISTDDVLLYEIVKSVSTLLFCCLMNEDDCPFVNG